MIAATCVASAMTAQTVTLDNHISGSVTGMSPDGKLIVGTAGTYDNDLFKSFIYDTATGQTQWKTEYDENDYDKTGQFTAITNSGIIAGSMKNKDMMIEISGGGYYAPPRRSVSTADDVTYVPLVTAAVWRDGKTYKLGTGIYDTDQFSDGSDGSYAVGISEDGSIVAGYIYSSWMQIAPIGWRYNTDDDAYDYFSYTLPNQSIGTIKSLSSDGSVAIGTTTASGQTNATVWTSPSEPQVINIGQESSANAVSRNGKYVLVSGEGYSNASLSIYEVETEQLQTIVLPDKSAMAQGLTIADNGDVTCLITDSDTWSSTLYYYSKQNGTIHKIDQYIELIGGENISSLNSCKSVCTSSDGLTIAGTSTYGDSSWVLKLPQADIVTINAPKGVEIFYNSTTSVTVKWNAIDETPENVTISGYQIFINDNLVETVDAQTAKDGAFRRSYDATLGTTSAYVKAVAQYNGQEIISEASSTATVSLSTDTSLFSFLNFDDATTDASGNIIFNQDTWTAKTPSSTEIIQWSLDAADFENYTPFLATTATSASGTEWNSILISRFFDAKDATNAYFAFYMKMNNVNATGQNLSEDFLDVEYSFDGENWRLLKSYCAADLIAGMWNNYITPLPQEIYGKEFQLRLNAHGQAMIKWFADNIGIIQNLEADAPTGLRTLSAYNNGVELTWHNSIGTYEVSHIENSNVLTDYNAGNAGQPLLTAVEFDPEKMSPFVGMYISSVSCFIYDNPDITTTLPTKAEAIVYVDEEEVSRQAFNQTFDTPYSSTVALSNPVKIEQGKTYRVATRIYDYDPAQTPVYYQSIKGFIPGKTDLYSEDEGSIWKKLSDVYTGDQEKLGWCIWPIRANITEEPQYASELVLDSDLLAYNVYRNGEQINTSAIYAAYPRFIDTDPIPGEAKYTVQAFYTSGIISQESDQLNVTPASITSVMTEKRIGLYPNPATDVVSITGDFDKASIINIRGQKVAETNNREINVSNLEAGIYFVQIIAENTTEVHKLIIKK